MGFLAKFPTAGWQRVRGSEQPSRPFRASLAHVFLPWQSDFLLLLHPFTSFIRNQEGLCFYD